VGVAVPVELRNGPFTVAEAARVGVDWAELQTAAYRRLTRGVYAWSRLANSPRLMFRAVRRRLPDAAVFYGRSSYWLHGVEVAPCSPVQVTVPPGCGVSARAGIWVRRSPLEPSEIVTRRGFPTTSIVRTVIDTGLTLPLVDAVIAADRALHDRLLDVEALVAAVAARAGTWNVKRLRQMVDLVDPRSESQMESRLRILLVSAGLPRPESQVDLHDSAGRFLGRADLYYPSHRLAIEYDGGSHRNSLVKDNRRQNLILGAGYKVRRFSAPDVLERPEIVTAQIRGELAAPHLAA